MKFEVDLVDDVAVIILSGDVDSRGNSQIDKVLRDLATNGVYKIVIDVSHVKFIGSQTISMLLSNMKEMRAGGGNIKLLNPQKTVMQYLKQNRMIELFDVYTTRAEALISFQPKQTGKQPQPSSPANPQPESPPKSSLKPIITQVNSTNSIQSSFETGEVLYTNSCMLASLIKILQTKGILTQEEAQELMKEERATLKGASE